MKRKNKLLIALLSATCLTAGAFGLVACENDTSKGITAVYNQYVANTEAAGGTALSYEDWLNSALTVGSQGEKGDKGDKGDNGTNGTNGKSAYEIYCDAMLKNDERPLSEADWLASLNGPNGTDGKSAYELAVAAGYTGTQEQWLASLKGDKGNTPVVHEHTYDNEVTTIFDATTTTVGLGYQTCTATDCDHIELVILNTYSYLVYVCDADHNPVSGAKVTINEVSVTTGDDGIATFKDLKKGNYDVIVTKRGYGAIETPKTSVTNTEFQVVLYPEVPHSGEINPGDNVGDKVSYVVNVKYSNGMMGSYWNTYSFEAYLGAGESGFSKYRVSLEGKYAAIQDNNFSSKFGGDSFDVIVTENFTLMLEVDPSNIPVDPETYEPLINSVSYVVTIERLATPALGSVPEAAIAFEEDGTVSYEGSAGEAVYLVYNHDTWEENEYKFTVNGAQLIYLGNTIDNLTGDREIATGDSISMGAYTYKFYFKAIPETGIFSISTEEFVSPGKIKNPIAMVKDTEYSANFNYEDSKTEMYYKLTLESPAKLTLVGNYEGNVAVEFAVLQDGEWGPDTLAQSNASILVYNFEEAGEYLIKVGLQASGEVKFRIRDYNAATDSGLGLTKDDPKALTVGTVEVDSFEGYYYVYTAGSTGGTLTITTHAVKEIYGEDEEYWFDTAYVGVFSTNEYDYESTIEGVKDDETHVTTWTITLEANESVWVHASMAYNEEGGHSFNVAFVAAE